MKIYNALPHVIECARKHRQSPQTKAYMKEYNAAYRKRPDVKISSKERYKVYYARPEVSARIKARNLTPQAKAYMTSYKLKPSSIIAAKLRQSSPKQRERRAMRLKSDANHAICMRLRSRLNCALINSGSKKLSSTLKLLGCSIDFLKDYLEARFLKGMTWENRSKWHIDHVTPCAVFNLTDPKQQRACFHYTNLRPMWAKDNIIKGAKVPKQHQLELI